MLREFQVFRGHKREVNGRRQILIEREIFVILSVHFINEIRWLAISWHPVHEELIVSGGSDGSIFFWLVG